MRHAAGRSHSWHAGRGGAALAAGDAGAMRADASFEAVLCQQGLQFSPTRGGTAQVRRVLVPAGGSRAVGTRSNATHNSAAMVEAIDATWAAVGEKVRSPSHWAMPRRCIACCDKPGFQHLEARCPDPALPPLDSFFRAFRAMSLGARLAAMEAATRTRMIGEIVHRSHSTAALRGRRFPSRY